MYSTYRARHALAETHGGAAIAQWPLMQPSLTGKHRRVQSWVCITLGGRGMGIQWPRNG